MDLRPLQSRLLLAYARPNCFVERTIPILARLGYRILNADDSLHAGRASTPADRGPELLIVEQSRLDEVLDEVAEGPPIVVLTGRQGVQPSCARIVGAINRPAGLHDLYRLIQQVFEDHPRSTPRVMTRLAAHCGRMGHTWAASLLSLSENGGLLRCEETLPLGSCFELSFELPDAGPLALRAEAAYQLLPDLGIVFSGIAPSARVAIDEFVKRTLLAA